MNKKIIRNEYKKKIRLIKNYNKKYYNDNLSAISDSDYDKLKKEVVLLEKKYNFLKDKNSPSKIVGHKPLKIAVTSDMIKFKNSKFKLTGLAFALEEIILRPYQLTGYLEIDIKNVPINSAGRYSISGLPNSGYEAGNRNKGAINKALGVLFNPADFLNNLFSKNPKQLRKLKIIRKDDEIKNLLVAKFDREILVQLLGIKRIDLEEIIRNCNYSDSFIKESNDLQVLEAISSCYEEYRIMQGTE